MKRVFLAICFAALLGCEGCGLIPAAVPVVTAIASTVADLIAMIDNDVTPTFNDYTEACDALIAELTKDDAKSQTAVKITGVCTFLTDAYEAVMEDRIILATGDATETDLLGTQNDIKHFQEIAITVKSTLKAMGTDPEEK